MHAGWFLNQFQISPGHTGRCWNKLPQTWSPRPPPQGSSCAGRSSTAMQLTGTSWWTTAPVRCMLAHSLCAVSLPWSAALLHLVACLHLSPQQDHPQPAGSAAEPLASSHRGSNAWRLAFKNRAVKLALRQQTAMLLSTTGSAHCNLCCVCFCAGGGAAGLGRRDAQLAGVRGRHHDSLRHAAAPGRGGPLGGRCSCAGTHLTSR